MGKKCEQLFTLFAQDWEQDLQDLRNGLPEGPLAPLGLQYRTGGSCYQVLPHVDSRGEITIGVRKVTGRGAGYRPAAATITPSIRSALRVLFLSQSAGAPDEGCQLWPDNVPSILRLRKRGLQTCQRSGWDMNHCFGAEPCGFLTNGFGDGWYRSAVLSKVHPLQSAEQQYDLHFSDSQKKPPPCFRFEKIDSPFFSQYNAGEQPLQSVAPEL
jgi:hypothetical protein